MEERRILSEKLFCHTPRSTENKSSEDNVVDLINLSEAFSKPNDIIFLENDDTENKNPKMECPGELSTDSNTKVKNPSPRQSNSIITSFIKHRKTENNSESSYDYALETENEAGKKADAQRYLLFRVEKLMRYLHEFNNDEIERKMYFDFDMPQMLPVQVRKGNLNCILFQQCLNKIMPDIEWMSEARFRRVILEEVLIGNPRVFRRLKSGTRNAWKLRKNHGTGKSRTENNGTENLENVHRVDINETDDESSQDTCSSVDSYFETPKLYRQFDQVELNGSGENTADNSSESENDAKIEIKNKSPKSKSQKNNTKTSEPSTVSESPFANKTTLKKSPKSNHPVFDHNNRDFEQEYKNYESQIQTRLGKYSVYEKKLKEKQVKQIKNRIETERTMKKNEGIESEIITKPIKSSYYNAEGYYEETNERDENYEPAYNEKYSVLKNCAAVHYQDATNVSQIDLPTGTGMMGILPQHVPTIGVLAAGWATVYSGANASRYFVSSGSYTITDSGAVMIAAEEALAESEIDMEAAKKQLVAYQAKVSVGSDVEKAEAQIAVEALEAMLK